MNRAGRRTCVAAQLARAAMPAAVPGLVVLRSSVLPHAVCVLQGIPVLPYRHSGNPVLQAHKNRPGQAGAAPGQTARLAIPVRTGTEVDTEEALGKRVKMLVSLVCLSSSRFSFCWLGFHKKRMLPYILRSLPGLFLVDFFVSTATAKGPKGNPGELHKQIRNFTESHHNFLPFLTKSKEILRHFVQQS